jgi:hypothetical protein
MRKDKAEIVRFRQEGWSYRQIQKETGVSRATLTAWFGTVPSSNELSQKHRVGQNEASRERMVRLNMLRKLKLQYQYALMETEATKQYQQYKTDPLFWAGLMLYASQGDVWSKGGVRIRSASLSTHRIFRLFIQKYLGIASSSIGCVVILYQDQNRDFVRDSWIRGLGFTQDFSLKTQVLQGKAGVKRLQYGTGMSILSNTALKKKLSRWLLLAESESF